MMKLSKRDITRRKNLAEKKNALQDEVYKYSKQIDAIDAKKNQEYRNSIINKCFALDSDGFLMGYGRVEYFKDNYEPAGTVISFSGKGHKKRITIILNDSIFKDWIDDGKKISHSRFNKYLKEATKMIKYNINKKA